MAAVRTKTLCAETATTTLTSIYTCPNGETAIIKSLTMGKFATGAVNLTITTLRAATAYGLHIEAFSLAAAVRHLNCWIVLMPGDVLRAQTDANTATVWASGAELEGVAD